MRDPLLLGVLTGSLITAAMGGTMQQTMSETRSGADKAGTRTLSYEGATTIGTRIMPEAAKLFSARTGVTFSQIGGAGADAGFKAAEERRVNFGGVARELTPEEKAKVAGAVVIG